MERPPRTVEYVCLLCGAQGLTQPAKKTKSIEGLSGGTFLRCPKCGSLVLSPEKKVAVVELSIQARVSNI